MHNLAMKCTLACIVSIATCFGTTMAQAEQLRFYHWADYIDPKIIEDFEEETGIDVISESYTEADVAEATLLAGGSGYDLAITSLSSLQRMRDADAIVELDQSRIKGADRTDRDISALMNGATADAERYSLLYLWGHVGVAFDEDAVRTRIGEVPADHWRLIFDPEMASKMSDCGIGIIDSVDEVAAAALGYLDRDPSSTNAEDLDAAFAAISAIAPYVRSFNSSQYDALIEGEICVALTWNTEGVAPGVEIENSPYRFVTPADGTSAWFDMLVLPAESQNSDAAYRFMNFLYRPEQMGRLAEWGYASGALAEARTHMSDHLSDHAGLFPDLQATSFHTLPLLSGAEKAALDQRWRRALLGM